MDGWMDGWMDGRMDGWMDGWMDGYKNQTFVARKKVYKGELPKIDKFIIIWRNEEKPKTKVISATSTKFILKSKLLSLLRSVYEPANYICERCFVLK